MIGEEEASPDAANLPFLLPNYGKHHTCLPIAPCSLLPLPPFFLLFGFFGENLNHRKGGIKTPFRFRDQLPNPTRSHRGM